MTAYKQACQKLNCKQIPKVLKQIQVESKSLRYAPRQGGGGPRGVAGVAGGTADPRFKPPGWVWGRMETRRREGKRSSSLARRHM